MALSKVLEVTVGFEARMKHLENMQKLMELQRDLVGLDSLVQPHRVRLPSSGPIEDARAGKLTFHKAIQTLQKGIYDVVIYKVPPKSGRNSTTVCSYEHYSKIILLNGTLELSWNCLCRP